MKTIIVIILFLPISLSVLSQETALCIQAIDAAVTAAANGCGNLGRNQACYGNVRVESELQADVTATFEKVGDMVDVANLRRLYTAPYDPTTEEWGIALMKLQANLPETLPGQAVTLILFGDVTITNLYQSAGAAAQPTPCTAIANSGVNVRSGPGTNFGIVKSLAAGEHITVTGRNAAGDWLRVELGEEVTGWVFASLVTTDCDMRAMPVVIGNEDVATAEPLPPLSEIYSAPMQAFTFRTGIGGMTDEAGCTVPPSALVVQTPGGATVNLWVNGVEIELGSTAVLQSGEGDNPLSLVLLQGAGKITAQEKTAELVEGIQAIVRLNESRLADSTPGVRPYMPEEYQPLAASQLLNLLPEAVELPDPAEVSNVVTPYCETIDPEWTVSADEPVIIGLMWESTTLELLQERIAATTSLSVSLDGVPLEDFSDYSFVDVASEHRAVIERVTDSELDTLAPGHPAWITYYPVGFLEPGTHTITTEFTISREFDTGFVLDGNRIIRQAGTFTPPSCTFTVQ